PQLAFAALAGLLVGLLILGVQNRRAVIEVLPSSIRQIVAPSPELPLPAFTCSDHSGGRSGESAQLTAVRSARQEGFDRLVFEFSTGVPAYEVTRQDSATFTSESANPVSLDGGAGVRVLLHSTDGSPQLPQDSRPALQVLREVSQVSTANGTVAYGVGLVGPVCARVIELAGPPRLVIDFSTSVPVPSPTATPGESATPLGPFACSDASGGTAGPPARLVGVRAAHQPGFDRIVFEFAPRSGTSAPPQYEVIRQSSARFVKDPSGQPISLTGSGGLRVVLRNSSAHGSYVGKTDLKTGLAVIAQASLLGDFEGVLSWGVGLSGAPCTRVLELSDPPRLVIDAAG
ncbi:MAG: hypothetical protein M3Z13_07280, partial [Candidatus Dormibacteraeota bacterium]|nr:hypothetical protein [Candidatus Dormibacteraeota bacterium]